jgi:hypothetical protein
MGLDSWSGCWCLVDPTVCGASDFRRPCGLGIRRRLSECCNNDLASICVSTRTWVDITSRWLMSESNPSGTQLQDRPIILRIKVTTG